MATINGREISLAALAGLSDEAIQRGLANGTIVATDQELGEINEKRREEGRSPIFNIINKSAAELGFIGREGTSDIQRAANLGFLLTALIPGGGVARGGAAALRAGGVLRAAALRAPLRAAATALGFVTRRPKTTAAIVGGGVLAGGVLTSALGGTEPAPPAPEGDIPPEDGTAVDAQLGDFDAALAEAQETGGFSGDIGGLGEITITRLPKSAGGIEIGGFLIRVPGQADTLLFDDELPAAVKAKLEAKITREDELRKETRKFVLEDAKRKRELDAGEAEELRTLELEDEEKARTFTLEAEELSRTQFLEDEERGRVERALDRSLREQELRATFVSELPGLIETFATPQGQLLSEAFFGRQGGELDIAGGQVGPILRGLFGLGAEERIPLPGASREVPIPEGAEGSILSPVPTNQTKTKRADPLALQQIPTQNFLANLTGGQSDLLSALFSIGGIDPRDIQRQQQRLAAPGSGRGVSAAVSRR